MQKKIAKNTNEHKNKQNKIIITFCWIKNVFEKCEEKKVPGKRQQ